MDLRAKAIVAVVGTIGVCGLAVAQAPDPRPGATTPVQVMNGASNPVPVTGNVTLGGSPSVTVSGSVATTSADSTVLIHEEILTVDTPVDANHRTTEVDVSAYKYVRVVAARGSCSACTGNTVRVENPYTLDQTSFPSTVIFPVFQEVYTVPGQKLTVAIANSGPPPATSQWMVRIYGRRN